MEKEPNQILSHDEASEEVQLSELIEFVSSSKFNSGDEKLIDAGDVFLQKVMLGSAEDAYRKAEHKEGLIKVADRYLSGGQFVSAKRIYADIGESVPRDKLLEARDFLEKDGQKDLVEILNQELK